MLSKSEQYEALEKRYPGTLARWQADHADKVGTWHQDSFVNLMDSAYQKLHSGTYRPVYCSRDDVKYLPNHVYYCVGG